MGKKIGFCLALALVAFCFPGSVPAGEKVYINGIDANFPPFAYLLEHGVADGLDVKALDWIAREMKFQVKHQAVEWDGIFESLHLKHIDIIASGMSITEKRKEEVSFTIPYWKVGHVIVVRKDLNPAVDQVLAGGKKVGVQRGTTDANWIEENLINRGCRFVLVYYDSAPLAVEDVLNGRIAGAAMDDAAARDAVKNRPVTIAGGYGMPDEDFGYAVRKEDTRLLEMLNGGLRKLMASPHWEELKKKYAE